MRKKAPSQGSGFSNNNQHRNKPRFSGGGGGQQGNNRPRKNYGQLREKYLQQARDALASGDRVLAENYFQHADHCYRMLAEEQASRPQQPRHPQPQESSAQSPQQESGEQDINSIIEEEIDMNNSALPAFLKVNYEQAKPAANETPAVQDWEERDQA
jgi:hypothetical protein